MKVLYFIYFSIVSLMPKSNMFKWQSTYVFFSIYTAFFLFCIYLVFTGIIDFNPPNTKFHIIFVVSILFGGSFILFKFLFLMNPLKVINMRKKFKKIPKWLFKVVGVLYCLVSFVGGMILLILYDKYFR